ncbi:MAG TPA: DUF4175 family protein [Candidatus Krumholzibacteria bacterium]|nr:DUF4175 family protein [Candidatus Krumholzibacteria bacterium]
MTQTPHHDNDALRSYLRAILLRAAALKAGSGLVSFLAAMSWVMLAVVAWTAIVHAPQLALATWVARITIAVAVGLFGWLIVWPLVRLPRLNQLAAEIEKRQDLKEMVRAGFEFSRDDTASQRYSPELVREVIRQAVQKLSGLQVRSIFLDRRHLKLIPFAAAGLLVLLGVALFNPDIVAQAGRRVVTPREVAALPHVPNLLARPGNVTVLAGSDVTVSGLDLGRSGMPLNVSFNLSGNFWKTEPAMLVHGAVSGPDAFDHHDYTFKDIRNTTSYYFEADGHKSEKYTITVVHEPILTDVRVTLTPPAYTGEAPTTLTENAGNVQALEGTKVRVQGRSNNPLKNAFVQFDEKPKQPVEHTGRDLAFDFTALADGHYKVLLEDSLGFAAKNPLAYSIEVFQDHPPTVDVLEPGKDTDMPRTQEIDLGFVAADDYGVARASLHYRKNAEGDFQSKPVPMGEQKSRKEVAVAYHWNISGETFFPGNTIEYYIEVADNNIVTGPGIARSKTYRITMPTIGQLYDTAREEEQHRDEAMKNAITDSKDLSQQLDKLSREYVKTEKMDWSQKKEFDKAMETQQAVQQKIEDAKKSLDDTLQKLSENEMTSQQIGEKMEEIRNLMEQINSDELKKYMEQLKQAMDKMSPEEMKQALENLKINTDEMLKNLERTANLLKEMQKQQQMEELVRKSQDLMNKQSDLNEQTEKTSSKDSDKMNELAKKQQELAKQAQEMKDATDKLSKDMDDKDAQSQLQQMSQEMQSKEGPQQDMQSASQNLSQQQMSKAQQDQQEALRKMTGLFKRLGQAQMSMGQNSGKKMAMDLQKYAKQTLELSFRQETLAGQMKASAASETATPESTQSFASQQASYLQATQKVTNSLMDLANQSMAIPPQLIQAMGDAINRMQSSMMMLEQDKSYMSTAHANNAVESLNQATIEMLRTAASCSSGSSGGSKQNMSMQMLQNMIPQQQDIMRETQEMLQMRLAQDALQQQRAAQLERLAGQQRSLQDVAKQIQESMKQERTGVGKLDRAVEDMQAVTEALKSGQINDDTVNKQQRILSRLLDAERSVNTRDYEQKRESHTAQDVFSKSLGKRADSASAQNLRDEIQRAMQLKAPGEFEDLIRLYFRALAGESNPETESTPSPGSGGH